MTLTIAAVAEHKAIAVDKIEVAISHTIEERRPWHTALKVRVDLGTGLTERERKILFRVSRSCEVFKMLTGEIACEYELV